MALLPARPSASPTIARLLSPHSARSSMQLCPPGAVLGFSIAGKTKQCLPQGTDLLAPSRQTEVKRLYRDCVSLRLPRFAASKATRWTKLSFVASSEPSLAKEARPGTGPPGPTKPVDWQNALRIPEPTLGSQGPGQKTTVTPNGAASQREHAAPGYTAAQTSPGAQATQPIIASYSGPVLYDPEVPVVARALVGSFVILLAYGGILTSITVSKLQPLLGSFAIAALLLLSTIAPQRRRFTRTSPKILSAVLGFLGFTAVGDGFSRAATTLFSLPTYLLFCFCFATTVVFLSPGLLKTSS